MFGMSIWLLVEPGFAEWVYYLDISEFYIGIYILIVSAIFVMLIAFIGCAAALMEHTLALYTVGFRIKIFITSKFVQLNQFDLKKFKFPRFF